MHEFMKDGTVILEQNGELAAYTVNDLLPFGFDL